MSGMQFYETILEVYLYGKYDGEFGWSITRGTRYI